MLANCSQQAVEVQLRRWPRVTGPILEDKFYQDGLYGGEKGAAGALRLWLPLVQPQPALAPSSWSAEERPQGHRRHRHTDAGSHFTRKIGADGHRFTPRAIVKGAVSGMIAAHWREQVVLMLCRLRLAGKLSLPRFFTISRSSRRGKTWPRIDWMVLFPHPQLVHRPLDHAVDGLSGDLRLIDRRYRLHGLLHFVAPSQTEQYSSPAAGPWSTGCGFSHALARCARHR